MKCKLSKVLRNVFLVLCFASCAQRNIAWETGMKNIASFVVDVERATPMRLERVGSSMPNGNFLQLSAYFGVCDEVDTQKARALIVPMIEGFICNINEDLKLKPYLDHFPFTFKDVKIGISFAKKDGGFVINNQIAYVSLIDGKLFYRIYNPTTECLENVAIEPYVEALEKVKKHNEELISHAY